LAIRNNYCPLLHHHSSHLISQLISDNIMSSLLHLAVRTTGEKLPGNKSPEQFAVQGRYYYAPSFAAAVIFCVLFGIVLSVQIYQFFRHRAWFWWVMILAITCKSEEIAWNLSLT
jgi:hypothetical protein